MLVELFGCRQGRRRWQECAAEVKLIVERAWETNDIGRSVLHSWIVLIRARLIIIGLIDFVVHVLMVVTYHRLVIVIP